MKEWNGGLQCGVPLAIHLLIAACTGMMDGMPEEEGRRANYVRMADDQQHFFSFFTTGLDESDITWPDWQNDAHMGNLETGEARHEAW